MNGPAITCCSSGSFHETFWFVRHWWTTSRICVASTQPARSTDLSAITCASVPSTGPVGDHRRADPHALSRPADQLGDPDREILAVPGRHPHADAVVPAGIDEPALRDVAGRPELVEIERERLRDRGEWTIATTFSWRDHESSVQFSEPGPHRLAVADHVLVVHQVGDAGDRLPVDRQRRDQDRVGLGRRRHRDRVRVVDVVGEARVHAALGGPPDRVADDQLRRLAQVEVVLGEVERRGGAVEERRDRRATSAGCWPPSDSVRISMRWAIERLGVLQDPRRSPATIPPADACSPFLRMKTYNAKPGEIGATGSSSTPRGRPWAVSRPRSPSACAARASRSTRRTSTRATSSSSSTPRRSRSPATSSTRRCTTATPAIPGGLRERRCASSSSGSPTEVLRKAVKGMLPRNKLGRAAADQAEDLRRPRPSARRRRRRSPRGLDMSTARSVSRHRQAQDVRRPRDPAPRRRQDLDQRQDDRGVLPAAGAPHAGDWRRSRWRSSKASTTSACACTAAGLPARPARCATASPARSSRSTRSFRVPLKRAGLPDARRPPGRAQEGRPAQGAQGAAVQQAVTSAAVARRYFGTDGVRGVVGEFLTADLVERLGRAAVALERRAARLRRPRHARLGRRARGGVRARRRLGRRRRRSSAASCRRRRSRCARSTSASSSPRRTTRPSTTASSSSTPRRPQALRRRRGGRSRRCSTRRARRPSGAPDRARRRSRPTRTSTTSSSASAPT